jgi:S-adenosylmethionine hydrolase
MPLATTFAEVPAGELALILDSSGRLALTKNGGSAAESLNVRIGDVIEVFDPRR